MTFYEWKETLANDTSLFSLEEQAWNHQQERIDELNECLEQTLSELEYWQDKANALEYDKTGV